MVFTSPPYFNRELYNQTDETQSYKAYPEYTDWRDNFLRPTLETCVEWLRKDRYLLWNIASIKLDSDNNYLDLEGDSRRILESLGCEYRGMLKMIMSRILGNDPKEGLNSVDINGSYCKYEPIFIFYKPK